MKKILLILFACVAMCVSAGAQVVASGSIASLKGKTRVNVEFDYSETMVKKSLNTVAELKAMGDEDWVKDLPEDESDCIETLNDALERYMVFGKSENVDCEMVIKILAIEKDLNNPRAEVTFKDKSGAELLKLVNVMDDDINGLGKRVARVLKRGLR